MRSTRGSDWDLIVWERTTVGSGAVIRGPGSDMGWGA